MIQFDRIEGNILKASERFDIETIICLAHEKPKKNNSIWYFYTLKNHRLRIFTFDMKEYSGQLLHGHASPIADKIFSFMKNFANSECESWKILKTGDDSHIVALDFMHFPLFYYWHNVNKTRFLDKCNTVIYQACCFFESYFFILNWGFPIKKDNKNSLVKNNRKENPIAAIFDKYPDSWKNAKQFKALMMDLYPDDQLRKNLINLCLDLNIPQDIFHSRHIGKREIHYFIKKMVDSYGCRESIAKEVVLLWTDALLALKNGSDHDLHKMDISDLNITPDLKNCLLANEISCLSDLSNQTLQQLFILVNGNPKFHFELLQITMQYLDPAFRVDDYIDVYGVEDIVFDNWLMPTTVEEWRIIRKFIIKNVEIVSDKRVLIEVAKPATPVDSDLFIKVKSEDDILGGTRLAGHVFAADAKTIVEIKAEKHAEKLNANIINADEFLYHSSRMIEYEFEKFMEPYVNNWYDFENSPKFSFSVMRVKGCRKQLELNLSMFISYISAITGIPVPADSIICGGYQLRKKLGYYAPQTVALCILYGARKAFLPVDSISELRNIPPYLLSEIELSFYSSVPDLVEKIFGLKPGEKIESKLKKESQEKEVQKQRITLENLYKENKLSRYIYNILKDEGFETLEDISSLSSDELKTINGIGNKSQKQVIQLLEEYGYSMKEKH